MLDDARADARESAAGGPELQTHDAGLPRARSWGVLLLVVLATAVVYLPVRDFDFLDYDDYSRVVDVPALNQGLTWEGVRWAFAGEHHFPPLAYVSHMVDFELFGFSAGAHHASNLLLHLVNTGLLFWALSRLTGRRGPSLFVAAVFALHPLNVESVAWVSERKNVLSTLFWLLTLGAYAGYARLGGAGRYAWVGIWLALGLASKSMLVTLPFVLMLLDFWPLGRLRGRASAKRLIVEKLPLLALCAGVGWMTVAAQSQAGSIRNWEVLALAPRLANAVVSYVVYLRRLVWPSDLAIPYPHPELLGNPLWSAFEVVSAIALLGAITLCVWHQKRSQPYLMVGWLWFLGVLVPVIGLVQVGIQAMADRYMYVAMIGPLMLIAWGARALSLQRPLARRGLVAAAVFVVVAAGASTSRQLVHWSNTLSLFERALATTEDNWVALNNVAWRLATCPDPQVRDGARAVALAERAVELTRRQKGEYLDTLAAAFAEAGRFDRAQEALQAAIESANATGQPAAARMLRGRLRQYERGEPMRASRGCPRTESEPAHADEPN